MYDLKKIEGCCGRVLEYLNREAKIKMKTNRFGNSEEKNGVKVTRTNYFENRP